MSGALDSTPAAARSTSGRRGRAEEVVDVLGRERRRRLAGLAVERRRGERPFPRLQLEDALLDGAGGDQLVDEDRLVLADAVGAVGRLVLNRRVPPRVVVDHRVGGGEVEAAPARLEAD